MTARFFADTNIAVYSLDENLDKRRRAFEIIRHRPVISVQVVNEFLSVLLSKRRLDRNAINLSLSGSACSSGGSPEVSRVSSYAERSGPV